MVQMDKSMLENLQRAVTLNPQFAEGHFAIGSFFHLQNNLGLALSSYQKAINVKPDFEQAYFRVGQLLRSQGKLIDAIAV